MLLPAIFSSLEITRRESYIRELLEVNKKAGGYGLELNREQASALMDVRNRSLRYYGRIELNIAVTRKLLDSFCESPFVHRENYLQVIEELLDVFYYLKNETEDQVGDQEVLTLLRESFEQAGGSLEHLKGKDTEEFIRKYRNRQLKLETVTEDEVKFND